MAALIAEWNAKADVWGDRMWAVLWQSTLFAAVVALVCAIFLRRTSPGVRYWVWQVVAIKLLVMPFWTYAIPLLQNNKGVPARELAETSEPTPLTPDPSPPMGEGRGGLVTPGRSSARGEGQGETAHARAVPQATSWWSQVTWLGWLLGVWATVVAAQVVRILWQHRRLARLLRRTSPADESLTALVRETAFRLGLRRIPRAVLTDVDCSPFVCGVRHAFLVLPEGLTATLSASELNHVLLHELAHVRRLDLVWGWIAELARMVYFFHPVVHWIAYRVRLERELACDQLAMSTSGHGAAEYAATLVRVVSQSSEPSVFKTSAASAGLNGETP